MFSSAYSVPTTTYIQYFVKSLKQFYAVGINICKMFPSYHDPEGIMDLKDIWEVKSIGAYEYLDIV